MRRALLLLALLAAPASADTVPLIVMDQANAQQLDQATDGEHQIVPRPIAAGPYAGSYAISANVLVDPAFAAEHDQLAALPVVQLDTDIAWPEQP